VLFSTPECRAVVIDLSEGDVLGDNSVHECAVAGEVVVTAGGGENSCSAGTLLTFAPRERHAARTTGGDACRTSPARMRQRAIGGSALQLHKYDAVEWDSAVVSTNSMESARLVTGAT
jgi:hypothetical protein